MYEYTRTNFACNMHKIYTGYIPQQQFCGSIDDFCSEPDPSFQNVGICEVLCINQVMMHGYGIPLTRNSAHYFNFLYYVCYTNGPKFC
jgi:hypothetical protein